MYDLIIKNGKIIDGTGSPYYRADVAVKDGKIARIGKDLGDAERVIDASGLTVTPGFIDSHSHADSALLTYPELIEKVEQGITTSITGQCGSSAAPTREISAGEFLEGLRDKPFGANTVFLIGHCTLRRLTVGVENRAPTAEELEKMKELLRDGLEHGAAGLSYGLYYTPGCYAALPELVALAQVVAEYNGIITAHIRNESSAVVQSVEEFLEIVRQTGARGVISHHKSAQKANWGKVQHTLRMIDEANEDGFEVYCDVYPYTASNTSLCATIIPKEYRDKSDDDIVKMLSDEAMRQQIREDAVKSLGEDLSWVMITSCTKLPHVQGKRISELAEAWGKSHYDAAFDVIRDSHVSCSASSFSMCEDDVETVLRHPRAMICTDSGVARHLTVYHPRLRGTFPRVLGRYVRERGVTTLQEMIRKMTAMPAMVYGLKGKGLLVEGFDADICIFDADTIIDRAEYVDCTKRAEGLNYVLVGGEIVAENAVYTGALPGKMLLK